MTADKPSMSPPVSPLAAISLKLVGGVTIVSSILDFLILLIPPQLSNSQWQLSVTTQIVDRGIVPLVGIALLLTGFWVDRTVGRGRQSNNLLTDLRFWSCLLASLLGLIFLIMTFLHVNNVRLAARGSLANLEQRASEVSTERIAQIDQQIAQLDAEKARQRELLTQLFQNEEQLQQAISTGQLPEDILQFRDDPEALNAFLDQRFQQIQQQLEATRQELETEIGRGREDSEAQIRQTAIKSAIRTSTSSFLLAIGYAVVGWIGLRRLIR